MSPRLAFSALAVLLLSIVVSPVWAQQTLENPQPGSFQSGVGVISGWACEAYEIEISFNGGPRLTAGTGTIREDTQGVCGDTDNGFGLLYNWNLLGDGPHTVTAYADGVEFASVAVTVTTLGEEFLRGASGTFPLADFPTPGASRTLRWQQAQQNFVITAGNPQGGGTSGAAPHVLENPQPGSFQSGVGVISGWVCEAQTIEISFDDGPRLQAGAGTIREDTHRVCGDTDNGFGLLYNWNLLGDGPHTVTAYADGVEFARVTVTVTTLGEEFRRGLSREVTVTNFPAAGTNIVLRWQEAQQNFVITQTTSTPVSTHFLPDTNLRRAVGEALGKPPGATITKAELAALRRLIARNSGIVDLTGLEFATNLTRLSLNLNAIADLTPLAGLTNLTGLWLHSNAITDLTPLAGLTNLTELWLGDNAIADLTPLAGLTNLTDLRLNHNAITDLTPLAGLTNLTGLSLDRNPIMDLTPLVGLTNLTRLWLGDNAIADLTPLAGLSNLTFLWLRDNAITDLTPLAGLTNLAHLRLHINDLTDLTPLAGLSNLTTLWLSVNAIADLTPLAGLTNLTELWLGGNAITDLTPLAGLTNLTTLWLRSNAITDLTPLAGLTNLTELVLNQNAFTDLTPLAGLTNLTTLYLGSNAIRDLTPLAGLTNLDTLNIAQTRVTELAPLFNLARLNSLHINGTPVHQEDLDMLAEAGVAIHGIPEVLLVSAVGDVDIHRDNVIVMHIQELPVTARDFDSLTYVQRLYEEFEDAFDYLMFVLNFEEKPEGFYLGRYLPARNDTEGIGRRLFVNSSYGSQEQLLTVMNFPSPSAFGGAVVHELMHTWANSVVSTGHGGHWGFSSADGRLGGFPLHDLVHLGGGRYKVQSDFDPGGNPFGPYSPIELYLAGLIPPDEVPDLWVAEDGKWLRENGKRVFDGGQPIFTATKVRTISIDDIIAEHGERIPDWTISQKDFQAAVVLLVDDDHPATSTKIHEMSERVSRYSSTEDGLSDWYNYHAATGGRAFITMDGLSEFLLPD